MHIVGVRFIEPLGIGLDKSSPYKTPKYLQDSYDFNNTAEE